MIEVVITGGLIGMVVASQITILSKTYFQYKKHMEYSNENMYIKEAFRIIENEVIHECTDVSVANDSITICKLNNRKSKIHFVGSGKSCGNIVIDYYNGNVIKTSNYVVKDIKSFKVSCKGKIMYLTISTINGGELNKCIGIERIP